MSAIHNIYSNIPDHIPDELFEEILKTKHVKIERIVSKGHSSADNDWYDQDQNEWVILLQGSARLLFKDNDKVVELKRGDHINIPSHARHKVEWTDPVTETIWLAVHY